jgi:hypothetical protein
MIGGAKKCCAPDGHCKTPKKQTASAECKQIAFDHHKSVDLHIDLPVVAVAVVHEPSHSVEMSAAAAQPSEPSPPDLQVLHSTFLI